MAKKDPIPEQDAAYIFVKDIFFNINENWKQIRSWLEEPCYPDSGETEDQTTPLKLALADRMACHEFSLAVLALEISKIPPQVMGEREEIILEGIYNELATLDSMEGTPANHLERVQTYLELMGFFSGDTNHSLFREKMLYYFYRNMGIENRNGWADIFLSSRLYEILTTCICDNWKTFHKSFVPGKEDQ